ncbi:MAG: FtsW/RodA/SpoVE family cell cycle protein [Planctomycetota bacterium]|nr:FtsW/RodA/SpoVE family cell cycle protein [Planctomycetota bacterium]
MKSRTWNLPPLEPGVILPVGLLLGVGLTFVWSTTHDHSGFLWAKQLLFVLLGLGAAGFVMRLGVERLVHLAYPIYFGLVIVLVLLPVMGESSGGLTQRWIQLPFGLKLQPSEFMKWGLMLALARHLQHRGVTDTWRSYLFPFLLAVVPWFLVMRQPDLGSSLVMLPVFVAMLFVSGARPKHVMSLAAATAVLIPLAYFSPGVLEPYQKDRVDAFLQPIPSLIEEAKALHQDRRHEPARAIEKQVSQLKQGTGRQQFYAVVAMGSGGLLGDGLGQGTQNAGNLLPVQHTDFIFAIIGEEWGLGGTVLVLFLFGSLVTGILSVAHRTREPFGRLLCVGVAVSLGMQAILHLGINAGILPVTGLTLPLVSYGGSSIVASLLAVGCVLDVARRKTVVFFEQ